MYAKDYRNIAWSRLSGHWGVSILAGFVAALFGASLSSTASFNLNYQEKIFELSPEVAAILAAIVSVLGILSFAQFIIGGTVQLGYCRFLLKQQDSEDAKLQDLFSQFDRFGVGFLQALLRGLYLFFWSLLFVIPGVIKTYSYAMTPFILADHPEMTANEAITASRRLMDGHKWELFCLGFSFIGWHLLSILTLGILELWIVPYQNAAYAAFYRSIRNHT